MKKTIVVLFALGIIISACKVTFVTGYDEVLDETVMEMKRDFNLHFMRLSRTIQDTDPNNQHIDNFRDYYDNMQVDIMLLSDRTQSLGGKSEIVKKQVHNLDSILNAFEAMHVKGLPDRQGDNRRDIRNGINSSFNAVIKLQQELKRTGKLKNN